jgi:hypothetical protein
MRAFTATVLHWVHQIGLMLWLGGILIIGAVLAPAVFGQAKAAGDLHADTPLYDFASQVMNVAFGKFNGIVLGSGLVMLIGGVGSGLLSQLCRKGTWLRAGLTLIAWGIAAGLAFTLYPQMLAAKAAGQAEAFRAMHKTYNLGFMAQLFLLLAISGLTAYLEAGKRVTPEASQPATVAGEAITA